MQKNAHGIEYQEIKKPEIDGEMKDAAKKSSLTMQQIYDDK